jgi:uncharacterized Zn finger protein
MPHLGLALRKRLREIAGPAEEEGDRGGPRRTVGTLLAEAEKRRDAERRRRAEEAERKRIAALEALARREGEVWREVEALIERKTGSAYDEAVQLLCKLRALAEYRGRTPDFRRRVGEIRERCRRRTGLMRRLDQAGLD